MISDSWAMGCTRCWDNVASCCWFEISPVLVSVVVSKIQGKIVRTLSEEKLGMKATPMQISSPCCQAQMSWIRGSRATSVMQNQFRGRWRGMVFEEVKVVKGLNAVGSFGALANLGF